MQILEDFFDAQSLTQLLRNSTPETLPAGVIRELGYHLGAWLAKFHGWTSDPRQVVLQDLIRQQRTVRNVKFELVYRRILDVLERYPDVAEGHLDTLRDFQSVAAQEEMPERDDNQAWAVIHGDLWSGNILIKFHENHSTRATKNELCVIDWELAQFGHRSIDVGQLIGDILEYQLVFGIEATQPLIEGIIKGYGNVSEDMAFRTATYIGAHLITWDIRRPAGKATPEVVSHVLRTGRDFMLEALAQNAKYFAKTSIRSLFGEDVVNNES